jgi:hypothetical protein
MERLELVGLPPRVLLSTILAMPPEFGSVLAGTLFFCILDRSSFILIKPLLLSSPFGSALASMLFCHMLDKSLFISGKSLLLSLFGEFHVTIKFSPQY